MDQLNQELSQAVEREVRQTLGDMHMQIIVLRQMLELQKSQQQSAAPQQPHTNGHASHANG